jgi:hypothetical protein
MNSSIKDYADLVEEWIAIRNANHGLFSDDELPLMDAMTDVWVELNELDRKRAELLVQQVPTASKHTVILDSDLMLPRRNQSDPLILRSA